MADGWMACLMFKDLSGLGFGADWTYIIDWKETKDEK